MTWLWWFGILGVGFGAGYAAHLILERHRRPNWGRLLFAGVGGALLAAIVLRLIRGGDGFAPGPGEFIAAVVGAVVVLAIDNAFSAKKHREARAQEKAAARGGHNAPVHKKRKPSKKAHQHDERRAHRQQRH